MFNDAVLFWVCVGLLGYTYLGYPALIWLWATLQPPPPPRRGTEPTVTLVIVAHNEAARIAGRLENLLSLDYPGDRVEIVLGSDGSTDGTADRGRAFDHAGVTVVGFETRRGKPAVLNDLVPKARGEIVIMADARQRFERGALRALTAAFEDPRVGAVSGELILTDIANATTVGKGVGFYWRYEKFIRANESRVDSTVGATGAIYAIRRELFAPIADDTMLDDVLIPLNVASRGYRVLFEPRARAYDRVSSTAREEFTRKVRTIAGNFQLFARERWLLDPARNRLWLQTVSHKALRLITPLLHVGAFVANLALVTAPFYRWTLGVQILFYTAALGGYALRNSRRRIWLLTVPYVICLLAWTTVVGFVRFAAGRQRVTWDRTS